MTQRTSSLRWFFVVMMLCLPAVILLSAAILSAADVSASAKANSDPTYVELRNARLSGESLAVKDVVLKRDLAHLIFKSGTIYFLSAVTGKVTGAVFVGEGNFQLSPALPMERHSLALLTKDSEGVINEEFNQVVLRFTDDTYNELKSHGTVTSGSPDGHATDALNDIRSALRRQIHYNLDGRILEDLLSDRPGGLFVAFIKGKRYSGKLLYAIDPHGLTSLIPLPVAPEEVALSTYDDAKLGVWCAYHLAEEYRNGVARSNQKNSAIVIKSQNLDTTLEKSGKLDGVAVTTFQAESDGVRVVPFDLFPSLRVESVLDSSGQALGYLQEDKNDDPQFFVILPKILRRGDTFVIKTIYSGKEAVSNESGGNYYPVARTNWYPNTHFGDYANYEMTFRIPKGLTMVATGTETGNKNEGNQNVTTWKSEAPEAVAGFNFGRFKEETAKNDKLNFTFESYANEEEPGMIRDLQNQIEMAESQGMNTMTTLGSISTVGMMKKALAEAQLAVELYTSYFGPEPYHHLAMTQQTAMTYGQSWPTLVYLPITSFFDSTIRHQLGFDDPKGYFKIVAPHEVAHQWWGHAVGFDSYRDQWMSEGFAEFSASLFIQVIQKNPKEFIKFWDDERELLTEKNRLGFRANDVGPLTMGYRLSSSRAGFDVARRLIYPKGGYILHMLRMMMWDNRTGDQKFIEMMHDFVKTYGNRVATTEDFKAMVEKHMTPGMDATRDGKMDWFFNEYVYGTALPHYELNYSYENGPNNTLEMKFQVTQSGVTDGFIMMVPVYLELADGRIIRLGACRIEGNHTIEEAVPLTGLKEKPKRVILNYMDDVLCTP